MKPTLFEVLRNKKVATDEALGFTAETSKQERENFKQAEEALYRGLMGEPTSVRLSHAEAITSRDFPMLLQRVINDRILMPIEPDYIGQTILSTTIQVGRTVGSYSIPAFGYIEASEVGEGMEYKEQSAEFNRNATSIALKKFGVRVAVTSEMMDADEMGLYGLHLLAAKAGMNRKKEEGIFSLFTNVVIPIFDNSRAFTDITSATRGTTLTQPSTDEQKKWNTTGMDINGDLNGTLNIFDVIDAMSVLLARGYDATDMLVNPLTWAILARDPILNAFYLNGRAMPAQVASSDLYKSTGPNAISNVVLPWNMTLHVTPFVPVQTMASGTISANVPFLTDIYIGSRRNGVLLLQGKPLQQDTYTDIVHEILNVRLKEYYGLGLADMGRSWVSIKNVRIDRAYDVPSVRPV